MRIVDLSMTVEECDSAPFAPDEKYFKLKPIIKWEDKGFVSNVVQMTVHAGTHIDSPHHFFRDKPSIEQLPLEPMMGKAVVLDLTAKGIAHASISPDDLDEAERKLKQQGVEIQDGGMLLLQNRLAEGPRYHRSQVVERLAVSHQRSRSVGGRQKAVRGRL